MPSAFDIATRFYAVHVANNGQVSLRWSEPFATAKEAQMRLKKRLEAGEATMGFIVRAEGEVCAVASVYPMSARKIIGHYRDLLAALEESRP